MSGDQTRCTTGLEAEKSKPVTFRTAEGTAIAVTFLCVYSVATLA